MKKTKKVVPKPKKLTEKINVTYEHLRPNKEIIEENEYIGQGLIDNPPYQDENFYYVPHEAMTEIQDLNEHFDELQLMRLKYMMDLYQLQNDKYAEPTDVLSKQNKAQELNQEQMRQQQIDNEILGLAQNIGVPIENRQEELLAEGEEPEEVFEDEAEKYTAGFIQPIKPVKLQSSEPYAYAREYQYPSEKYIQPMKRVFQNPEYLSQQLAQEDFSMMGHNNRNPQKGGDLFINVGENGVTYDTWSRWMDRNGYRINDNYEKAYIANAYARYSNGDINQSS